MSQISPLLHRLPGLFHIYDNKVWRVHSHAFLVVEIYITQVLNLSNAE